MAIQPVPDWRDNSPEIKEDVVSDELENKLDEADRIAALSDVRYTSAEVFDRVRQRIRASASTQ